MKKGDKLIILSVALLALIIFAVTVTIDANNKNVLITVEGEEYITLPLNVDDEFTISNEYGSNTIQIKDGCVRVISADCPDQICVHTKPAEKVGDIIVCLPHRLVITIERAK